MKLFEKRIGVWGGIEEAQTYSLRIFFFCRKRISFYEIRSSKLKVVLKMIIVALFKSIIFNVFIWAIKLLALKHPCI